MLRLSVCFFNISLFPVSGHYKGFFSSLVFSSLAFYGEVPPVAVIDQAVWNDFEDHLFTKGYLVNYTGEDRQD